MNFQDVWQNTHKKPAPKRLLALDPGGTTGWAYFEHLSLKNFGQIKTTIADLETLFRSLVPTEVACEDYRIYEWKLREHANSSVLTLRILGAIDTICYQKHLPLTLRMAQHVKAFCTDNLLRQWGFYQEGMPHANDAIRHGTYHLLFNSNSTTTNYSRIPA